MTLYERYTYAKNHPRYAAAIVLLTIICVTSVILHFTLTDGTEWDGYLVPVFIFSAIALGYTNSWYASIRYPIKEDPARTWEIGSTKKKNQPTQ
jgi:hypothetical protein